MILGKPSHKTYGFFLFTFAVVMKHIVAHCHYLAPFIFFTKYLVHPFFISTFVA